MKNQHETPEALAHALFTAAQLAPGEGIEDAVGRLAALVEAHQHARIAELEAQLSSSGFTAADMATAAAQGFRDGAASLSANAGEPVAWWIPKAEQFCLADKSGDRPFAKAWEPLYAAPPTAQAEGWISVDEELPPVRVTVFVVRGTGPSAWRTMAFYDPDRYQPAWRCNDDPSEGIRGVSHWMHMPLPPTSAEGVEHG